jgi:hypothetical protein
MIATARLPSSMFASILRNVACMNYFAHGRAFIESPFFLAGTALPDLMNIVDRRNRIRSKSAVPLLEDADPAVAQLAAGVVRHHQDDAWFHESAAFAELSLQFTVRVRDALPGDEGFRPHFLGHILVEILLDAALIAQDHAQLEAYYAAFDALDVDRIRQAAERMAPRPIPDLARGVQRFSRERFLWDYLDDGKLSFRLNQVMRRVGLPTLPDKFQLLLPDMRRDVAAQLQELLEPPEIAMHRPTAVNQL